MRIALVSPYAWSVPGGVNDHISNLSRELDERGHETWIVAPTGPPGRQRDGVPFPGRFIPVGTAIPVPSNGSSAYVNIWPWTAWNLNRRLRGYGFDLIHLHEPCVFPTSFLTAFLADVPMVGTFHAAGEASRSYVLFWPAVRQLMKKLSVRIAVSGSARDYVAVRHPGDYRIIPNGVSPDAYADAWLGGKQPGRVLFIGRPEPRKGLHVLLRAFQGVRENHPNASLHVVGTAPHDLQRVANEIWPGLRGPLPGVKALGRVSHDDKVREMRAAEVVAVPSLQSESFGVILIEAMAAGLPVVASDLAGYRAVLDEGRLGKLVAPGDQQALAESILTLLGDERLRQRMSVKGRTAVHQFAWARVAGDVLTTYEEATGSVRLPTEPESESASVLVGDAVGASVRRR